MYDEATEIGNGTVYGAEIWSTNVHTRILTGSVVPSNAIVLGILTLIDEGSVGAGDGSLTPGLGQTPGSRTRHNPHRMVVSEGVAGRRTPRESRLVELPVVSMAETEWAIVELQPRTP